MKYESMYESLLDLSKNNRLINFKERLTTLCVKAPLIDTLYKKLFNFNDLYVYDIDKFIYKVNGHDYNNEIYYDDIYDYIKDNIKEDNIVLHKNKGSIKNTLKNIKQKASEALDEKGLNILYLTIGMLNYKEDTILKAPIILIPIKIEEAKLKSYKISLYEEEAIINPTLRYKLKEEYKIALKDFDIDSKPSLYLEYLKKEIKKKDFEITDESYIGLFMFNKINMYEDLKENKDKILKNPIVKAILEGSNVVDNINYYKEDSIYNIYDADYSQKEAIKAIKSGKSIVLEGPPGTGKSQTITNIISSSIADGKKVLFVSEKMAALNVVYDKLKQKGLDEFSLAIHSTKTNKKNVINEIYNTLNINKNEISNKDSIDEIYFLESTFDIYAKTLHKKIDKYDLTPYEVIDNYYNLSKYSNFDSNKLDNLNKENYKYILNLFNEYISYKDIIEYDYKKFPFDGYLLDDSKKSIKILDNIKELLTPILRNVKIIKDNFNLDIYSLDEYKKFISIYKVLSNYSYLNKNFFDYSKLDIRLSEVKTLIEYKTLVDKNKSFISLYYSDDIYSDKFINLYDDLVKFKDIKFKIFKRDYRNIKRKLKVISKKSKALKYNVMLKSLSYALESYKVMVNLSLNDYNVKSLLKDDYKKFDTDFKSLYNVLDSIKSLTLLKDYNNFLLNKFIDIDFKEDNLDKLLNIKIFDKNILDINNCDIKELHKKIVGILSNISYFKFSKKLNSLILKFKESNIINLLDNIIDSNIKLEEFIDVFRRVYFKNVLDEIISNNPILKDFSTLDYNTYEEKFIKYDKEMLDLNRSIIINKLRDSKPSLDVIADNSSASCIKREHEKKRRQMSVREFLNSNVDLILTLKPVFLMSPLSVSTYLIYDNFKFDLVIFDEASQIFPCDAIPAISRAKQVVIVGDSKQMPPSNFFSSTDFEENDDEVSDFESILDMAKSTLKTLSLKWHYRSQSEDLITYSNSNFYNKELITFPNAINNKEDFGVEGYYIDGIYNRDLKNNLKEAKEIVRLCKEHMEKYKGERSLGVVAFSISQERLIKRCIEESGISFDDLKEPFFIKNLETVQGDERDTIIFSIGYGYDEGGKFIQNFGPLNKEGGERRLNVAISRARLNMKVVCSIKGKDITNTKSVGASMLKGYLDFVFSDKSYKLSSSSPSGFILEVKNFLEENGYKTITNVGYSNAKIDLCIYDKDLKNLKYAIEDDGNLFNNLKDASNRIRLRSNVLSRMGFKYIKLWSYGWYNDLEVNKNILLKKLKDVRIVEEEKHIFIKETSDTYTFDNYLYVIDDDIINKYLEKKIGFEELFNTYLNLEGPINETWMLNRISKIYGYDTYDKKMLVEYELDKAMNLDLSKYEFKNDFIYIKNKEIKLRVPENGSSVRNISNISLEEIASGMKVILVNNKYIKKEDLYKTLSKTMGYKRLNDSILKRFDESFEVLKKIAVVIIKDDKINVVNI